MNRYLIKLCFFLCLVSVMACGGEKPVKKASSKEKKELKTPAKKKETKEKAEVEESEPVPPEQLKRAKKLIASYKEGDIDAKKLFKIHCTVCHGLKGNMKINGAKDLQKSTISLEESVAQVFFGKGLMTPYGTVLSNDEIVAVAKYTEGLRK